MRPYQLSEDEVAKRLEQYHPSDVTECLYRFGTMMIQENLDRTKQLETKTTAVAGYSGAMLAFLIARPPTWLTNPTGWGIIFVLCAGVFASLAITCALFALQVRHYRWFSDSQWFENENDLLNDTDQLKRYHILAMHGINQRMGDTNEQKANWIFMAQIFLALAALSVAVILWIPHVIRYIPVFW